MHISVENPSRLPVCGGKGGKQFKSRTGAMLVQGDKSHSWWCAQSDVVCYHCLLSEAHGTTLPRSTVVLSVVHVSDDVPNHALCMETTWPTFVARALTCSSMANLKEC